MASAAAPEAPRGGARRPPGRPLRLPSSQALAKHPSWLWWWGCCGCCSFVWWPLLAFDKAFGGGWTDDDDDYFGCGAGACRCWWRRCWRSRRHRSCARGSSACGGGGWRLRERPSGVQGHKRRFLNCVIGAVCAYKSYLGQSSCGLCGFFRSPGPAKAGQATH